MSSHIFLYIVITILFLIIKIPKIISFRLAHRKLIGFQFCKLKHLQVKSKMKLFSSNTNDQLIITVDANSLPDCKRRLQEVNKLVNNYLSKEVLDLSSLKESVRDMEQESAQPKFWDDLERAQSMLGELNRVKFLISRSEKWLLNCDDISMMIELAIESPTEAGILILIF